MTTQPFNSDGGFNTTANIVAGNLVTAGSGGAILGTGDISTTGNVTAHDATFGGNINGAGTFNVDGDSTIGGNLFVTGNINFSGNVTQITGNSGVFYGNVATGVGAIYAGKQGFTPLPNTVVQITGDDSSYIQVNLQNTNHSNVASMDMIVTADDGTDSTNYIDMGIASSTWDGTQDNSLGNAVGTRDGYLYTQGGSGGGNLVLGTTTAGRAIKFNVGGPGEANTRVAIDPNNGLIALDDITGGNLLTAGNVSATGNISGNYILGDGSQLTNLPGGSSNYIQNGTSSVAILSADGNATIGVNATPVANFGVGLARITGNVSANYFIGNGSQLTGLPATYGNSNVATLLSAFGSNAISTTGTVTAGNTFTTGNAQIGTALLIVGSTNTIQTTNGSAVQFANRVNFNAAGSSIVASGNISGANILGSTLSVSGNVTGNYILGNAALMTGIPASYGNANLANIGANSISTTGNISAGYLFGNASQLTGLPATYGNANVAAYLPTYLGNLNAGNIISSGNANINLDPAGTGIVAIVGSASATGNIVTAGNFVGNGAALTNVTVSVAGNVVGTQANVGIVAGSYTWTFDNTGNVTLPTGGDLVFSANTTLTSVGGTNGNITINPDGTGQLVVTNITPAYFGNSVAITGPIRTGNGSYANNPGNGDIVFNNGGIDTPGVTFYYGNNTNFGIDSYSGNAITTPNYLRIVKNLNEAGAAELIKIDQGGNISFAGSAMSIFTTQRKFDWTAMIHGNPATGGSITGSLLGNASYTNVSDGVTLTPNTTGQSGSVAWNTTTFDFTKDFVMEWSWFTSTGGVNPADGVWATFGGNTNGGAASPAGTTNGSIGLRYQTFTNLKTQWYSNGATTGNAVAFRAGVTYQGEWQTSRIMVRTVSNKRYAYVYTGVGGVCDNAIDVTSWTPAGTWIAVGASTGSATSGQLCCHVALEYL